MDNIGKFKKVHSVEERKQYEKDRIQPIKEGFVVRKKELMKYVNTSIASMEEHLVLNNLYYVREKSFFNEKGQLFYADFFIPELRLVIEIDGGYHTDSKRAYVDKVKEILIAERGYPTVRITNEDVFNLPLFLTDFLLKGAKKFWKTNKDEVSNYSDVYFKWCGVVEEDKRFIERKLRSQFKERLKDFNLEEEVEEIDKNGNVLWTFSNIFDYHYKTGIKFKLCLDRFHPKSNRWVTKLRYKEDK